MQHWYQVLWRTHRADDQGQSHSPFPYVHEYTFNSQKLPSHMCNHKLPQGTHVIARRTRVPLARTMALDSSRQSALSRSARHSRRLRSKYHLLLHVMCPEHTQLGLSATMCRENKRLSTESNKCFIQKENPFPLGYGIVCANWIFCKLVTLAKGKWEGLKRSKHQHM